jgi:hypothetical protein
LAAGRTPEEEVDVSTPTDEEIAIVEESTR